MEKEGVDFNYDLQRTRRGKCQNEATNGKKCTCKRYEPPQTGYVCECCDHKSVLHADLDSTPTNQGKNSFWIFKNKHYNHRL